jgi:hypothetical protein
MLFYLKKYNQVVARACARATMLVPKIVGLTFLSESNWFSIVFVLAM